MKERASYVALMVRNHPVGRSIPRRKGILDTPAKINAYVERMHAATYDQWVIDQRAASESVLRARTHIVDKLDN